MSEGWANPYELTLAKDFVDHLDGLAEGESGRMLFEVEGTDAANEARAAECEQLFGERWRLVWWPRLESPRNLKDLRSPSGYGCRRATHMWW